MLRRFRCVQIFLKYVERYLFSGDPVASSPVVVIVRLVANLVAMYRIAEHRSAVVL